LAKARFAKIPAGIAGNGKTLWIINRCASEDAIANIAHPSADESNAKRGLSNKNNAPASGNADIAPTMKYPLVTALVLDPAAFRLASASGAR